eukprot:CAMPEP_0113530296 /NCGR_PEP_ID=MMETSP0015_2-20120614/2858_1 /TAXON_ID=2838 /ORGANISM="Odontella" /LENGTH=190 /DNA_ID=CAMNT_0000428997 /DNA_START=34 /DNA_END=606 /DNA_ORIENTATION=- /assembly_acc=CAM_ASM_000160
MPLTNFPTVLVAATLAFIPPVASAFVPHPPALAPGCQSSRASARLSMSAGEGSSDPPPAGEKDAALDAAINAMFRNDPTMAESPVATKERIQSLVDGHRVLLFMKGSRVFPQCGFSNTAVQILESFGDVEFHTIDVLSDLAVREGVKVFSQWPTIPQLYIDGEFVGGSDIMIDMYQSGDLKDMLKKTEEV